MWTCFLSSPAALYIPPLMTTARNQQITGRNWEIIVRDLHADNCQEKTDNHQEPTDNQQEFTDNCVKPSNNCHKPAENCQELTGQCQEPADNCQEPVPLHNLNAELSREWFCNPRFLCFLTGGAACVICWFLVVFQGRAKIICGTRTGRSNQLQSSRLRQKFWLTRHFDF